MTNNRKSGWWWAIGLAALAWWAYDRTLGPCDRYASEYSCSYVIENADYEVFYWRNVGDDDASDERPIGRVKGLRDCKDAALRYSASINEPWNERAYVCVLVKDGEYMEKHRLLD
jgi:hypothetical protein